MGLVGHERRASQRALYESSIISGVRIDDYSKMRMGLTVRYTSLIIKARSFDWGSHPLKKGVNLMYKYSTLVPLFYTVRKNMKTN